MSQRKRSPRRRIQPYAWLGAGAVTLGMGAAMVGGTAVAFADTGTDSAASTSSTSSSDTASNATRSETKNSAPKHRAARAARADANAGDDDAAAPSRRSRVAAVTPDLTAEPTVAPAAAVQAPAATTGPVAANDAPTAAATTPTTPMVDRTTRQARQARITDVVAPDPAVADSPSQPAPAAAVAPAATTPAPSMESWLPGGTNPDTRIVPGARVALAMGEIKAAQALITQETWGSGNILAGIGAIAPQALLATAQLSLMVWGATNPGVQNFLASTEGIPLIHQIAQIAVFNEFLVPRLTDLSLTGAALLIPALGWVGADVDAAQAAVASARQNAKIYAVVPIRIKAVTQPMVNAKINGGSNASLLVDSGASGLVTTRDSIGTAPLGAPVGSGNSCFSGGLCYHYETYLMPVDLGDGAVATAPVNIVTDIPGDPTYENSVANFKKFFFYGDGILGVGANTAGPGPAPIPTAAMPGELHDGVLVFQNFWPLGLGGFMILGPNPLPTRVSLPGAPDAYVKVRVNDGPLQDGGAIIDSGGVYGTLNRSLYPGSPAGTYVPADTTIDVYAPDGETLLYSYTTGNETTPFIDAGLFNTGTAAFKQNPIYLNYGASDPYGIGSTDFSIW